MYSTANAGRTGNWNVIAPSASAPTRKLAPKLGIGTRVVRKADGRPGKIVARNVIVPSRPGGMPGPTVLTIRYDDGGFDASGDTGWVRSYFKVLS